METNINLSLSGDAALRVLRALVDKADDVQTVEIVNENPPQVERVRPYSGRTQHVRLTAEQKAAWARERRALVNFKITQPGPYNGALIIEHVKGTLYRVMLTNGEIVNVSHKKQKTLGGDELGAGWSKWVD